MGQIEVDLEVQENRQIIFAKPGCHNSTQAFVLFDEVINLSDPIFEKIVWRAFRDNGTITQDEYIKGLDVIEKRALKLADKHVTVYISDTCESERSNASKTLM